MLPCGTQVAEEHPQNGFFNLNCQLRILRYLQCTDPFFLAAGKGQKLDHRTNWQSLIHDLPPFFLILLVDSLKMGRDMNSNKKTTPKKCGAWVYHTPVTSPDATASPAGVKTQRRLCLSPARPSFFSRFLLGTLVRCIYVPFKQHQRTKLVDYWLIRS